MLGINIETEMRRRSFDHLQKLSFSFFDNQKTGRLVARITKDLEEVGEVAHHGPEDVVIAVMQRLYCTIAHRLRRSEMPDRPRETTARSAVAICQIHRRLGRKLQR